MAWLSANAGTILVLVILAVLVGAVILKLIRDRRRGITLCDTCASADSCAIHAAGKVGCAELRPELRAFVSECSNFGKVNCVSGRKASICASAVNVKTGGSAANDVAEVLSSLPAGANVIGYIEQLYSLEEFALALVGDALNVGKLHVLVEQEGEVALH